MSHPEAVPPEAPSTSKTVLIIMVLAGLGGILYGFDIGVISGALGFMQEHLDINTTQGDLVVAAVLWGGAVATLVSGPFADRYGRRFSMNLSAVVFIVGTVVLMLAHNFATVMIGRLVQGVGVGIITIVVPLYLAETVPTRFRGRGVALFQFCLTFGILLGYLVNYFLKSTGDWRLMFGISLVPSVLFLVGGLFFLPRSPRWLYVHGHEDEARQVLRKSQGAGAVDASIRELATIVAEEKQQRSGSWGLLLRPGYRKPFLIALAVGILNQLSGVNVLLQYNATILGDAGLENTAILGSVLIGAVNFLVTFLALFLVDRLGRRPLLITGTAGVMASLLFIGVLNLALPHSAATGYATLAGFMAFMIFFAIGPGVVVWLAISEILPLAIRAKGMAIALFANSATSALLASIFMSLVGVITFGGTFVVLGVFALLYLLVAVYALPETKGRSLEEIEEEFFGRAKAP